MQAQALSIDTLDIITPDHYAKNGYPHSEWTLLRREAPVYWYDRPNVEPFWAITKHADIVTIGRQPKIFLNGPRLLVVTRDLVIPGGESTTLAMLLTSSGLADPIAHRLGAGMPVLGTCAGLILLATRIADGRPDQWGFGAVDVAVRRNGYGRQQQSFEASLDPARLDAALVDGPGGGPGSCAPLPAVFIRAPRIEAIGPDVEVLAVLGRSGIEADPVLVRQGPVLATAFHPELTGDLRVHRLFASMLGDRWTADGGAGVAPVGRSRPVAGSPVPSMARTDTQERC